MGINLSQARAQASQLNSFAKNLKDVKRNLSNYKSELNNCWKAKEMTHFNLAIDNITNKISDLASSLELISDDVESVAQAIKAEEEAKARAEAEAKARAEAEAKAKAKAK